jgi:PEGA domain-containing protein
VLKRFLLTAGLAVLALGTWPQETAAQVRRVPVRRVVVVPTYVAPLWYYDPWYGFYDYQWGYPPYGPYGPYRHYNLAPESSVRLEVKPKQAEVFVDGYYAGVVDDFDGTFQRLRLPPGEHEIALYLDGYRSVHQKVYLTPDNTFKMKYELEKLGPGEQPEPRPQPANPPAAEAGAQPPPAYPPAPRTPGRRAPLPPPQPRAPRSEASAYGSLAVRVQPADAEVLVDGEHWNAPEGQSQVVIDVPEGRHTVQIQKPGYRSYITDVEVRRGETTPLNVSLRSQED